MSDRRVRSAGVLLLVAAVSVGAVILHSRLNSPPGTTYWHDPTGLLVMKQEPTQVIPESLRDSYGIATRLSEDNRDDFGFPLVQGGRVILPVTSEHTAPLAHSTGAEQVRALKTYQKYRKTHRADYPYFGKTLPADDPSVVRAVATDVDLVEGIMTSKQSEDAVSDVLDLANQFPSANAWQTSRDIHSGQVVLVLERLTPGLATKLVQRFGVDAVIVVEEPRVQAWPA